VKIHTRLAEEANRTTAFGQHRWDPTWTLPRPGCGLLLFEANTTDEIIVGFSPESRTENPMYELSLGPKGAFVRKESQGFRSEASYTSGSALAAQPGEWGAYWIRVENGELTLGHKGDFEKPLLRHSDAAKLSVRYVSITYMAICFIFYIAHFLFLFSLPVTGRPTQIHQKKKKKKKKKKT
jgi:hypothetical protein